MTLKQQALSFDEKSQEFETNIANLHKRLTTKETQHKDCESKCLPLTQKVASLTLKLGKQTTELGKLKLDMDIMDKSIIDSLKTRQQFKEQVTRLEKEVESMKDNPVLTLKLQEVQKQLSNANGRVELLQKALLAEKKAAQSLTKEKNVLSDEHKQKASESEKQLSSLNQNMAVLNTCLSQKVQHCALLQQTITELQDKINQMENEIQKKTTELKAKEEEYRTKVCEYCGF